MRATFNDSGDLVLHPETTLERMAAKQFVQSMRHRNKPQILIDAGDGSFVPQTRNGLPIVVIDEPGQQRLDEVARSVGGI